MRGLKSLRKEWQRRMSPRWRIFVIAAIAGPLAAFLFAWSGIYNVAASRGHFRIVEWALDLCHEQFGRNARGTDQRAAARRSELAHSRRQPFLYILRAVPRRAAVSKPTRHCRVRCRQRPTFTTPQGGGRTARFTGSSGTASNTPACRRGRPKTGDDEVWAVVAFIKALPKLDAPRYRELAIGNSRPGRD